MAEAVADKSTKQGPFGVVIDHQRNCDVILQSIPGSRLRSTIKPSRTVTTPSGDKVVPRDQATHLGMLGEVPGMEIHVNPSQGSYMIRDPLTLEANEGVLDRVRKYKEQQTGTFPKTLRGVPDQKGTLDQHRMKTLCRELFWLVESGDAQVIKGDLAGPRVEESRSTAAIDRLPGNYLLNPGASIPNTQPQFEKDYDNWVSNLSKTGG